MTHKLQRGAGRAGREGTAAGAAEAKCCPVGPRDGMSRLRGEHGGSQGLSEPLQ